MERFNSITAFVISVVTAYLTLFRRARLRPCLGKVMLVQYQGDGRIHLKLELSIQNPGASVAVVYDIVGELRRLTNNITVPLSWQMTLTTEFDPETHGNDTRFKSFPETFFINKTDAVLERLQFQTQDAYLFEPEDYELELAIHSDGTMGSRTSVKSQLCVMQADIDFLNEHLTSKDGPKKERNLLFWLTREDNISRYASKLPSNISI